MTSSAGGGGARLANAALCHLSVEGQLFLGNDGIDGQSGANTALCHLSVYTGDQTDCFWEIMAMMVNHYYGQS